MRSAVDETKDPNSEPNPFPNIYLKERLPEHLCQGDIILGYESRKLPKYKPDVLGIIVLSETCDLANPGNVRYVSLSPIYPFEVFVKNAVRLYVKKRGPDIELTKILESVSGKAYKMANYEDKRLFFLPPDEIFKESAGFSSIDQISHVSFSCVDDLFRLRKASLLSPWREKLGYKTGYLFNRVATDTPEKERVTEWIQTNFGGLIEGFSEELKDKAQE